jgi:hypothetical protein
MLARLVKTREALRLLFSKDKMESWARRSRKIMDFETVSRLPGIGRWAVTLAVRAPCPSPPRRSLTLPTPLLPPYAPQLRARVQSTRFWRRLEDAVNLTAPIVELLRLADSTLATMGKMHQRSKDLKEKLCNITLHALAGGVKREVLALVDNRLEMLHTPLHSAGKAAAGSWQVRACCSGNGTWLGHPRLCA